MTQSDETGEIAELIPRPGGLALIVANARLRAKKDTDSWMTQLPDREEAKGIPNHIMASIKSTVSKHADISAQLAQLEEMKATVRRAEEGDPIAQVEVEAADVQAYEILVYFVRLGHIGSTLAETTVDGARLALVMAGDICHGADDAVDVNEA